MTQKRTYNVIFKPEPEGGFTAIVPYHLHDIPKGTLLSLIREAGRALRAGRPPLPHAKRHDGGSLLLAGSGTVEKTRDRPDVRRDSPESHET